MSVAAAPAAQIEVVDQRVCCKISGCINWASKFHDNVCVYHINNLLKEKPAAYLTACKEGVGLFGLRKRDKASFAAVFHEGIFCVDDVRLPSAQIQAVRAVMIEKNSEDLGEEKFMWKLHAARYLFVIMNPGHGKRLGHAYDNPQHVFDCIFNQPNLENEFCYYPSNFDFYVLDPTVPKEMDFLLSIMEEEIDTSDLSITQDWWGHQYFLAQMRKKGMKTQ